MCTPSQAFFSSTHLSYSYLLDVHPVSRFSQSDVGIPLLFLLSVSVLVVVQEGGEGLQVVPPDLLQSYIQQLILAAAGGGAAGGEEREDVDAATTNAMQVTKLYIIIYDQQVSVVCLCWSCVCSNCIFFSN